MYRRLIIIVLGLLGWAAPFSALALEETSSPTKVKLVPDHIRSQPIYQSPVVSLELSPWRVQRWQTVEFPIGWGDHDLYVELWDSANHRISLFRARRMSGRTMDISALDPTLYPAIRLIVFQAKSPTRWPDATITFTHTETFNSRLATLIALISLMLLGLVMSSWRYRLTPLCVWRSTSLVVRQPVTAIDPKNIIAILWVMIAWSAVFSIPLGSFAGPIQIAYLFIKLPFLFLCSFLISVSANVVIAKLMGVPASLVTLVSNAIQTLALTAITLAAFSPILWWWWLTKQNHDVALLWSLLLFGLAYLIGIWRLYRQYQLYGSKFPVLPVFIWMCVYGVVLLQVGWLLRPWVGVLDPIYQTVPFSRLYSGNVFEEILFTFQRLSS